MSVPVTKIWIGTPAESVTINLYLDGVKIADVVLSKENSWEYTFTRLDQYDHRDGHGNTYTITEDAVSGYRSSITGNMKDGFKVTNTELSVPSTDVPQTGDGPRLLMYILLMIFSEGMLLLLLMLQKKVSEKKKIPDLK